tara:strand:- start:6402 stop:6761 length:360 start_codon:yes stop_codon:yes gene_type:complete
MKLTKSQLKQIIKEELAKVLNEQAGTFTYNVIDDEDDGGPFVKIGGITTTFEEMLEQMNGQTITFADGDVEQFNFSDHAGAVDAADAAKAMIRNGIAHYFVEAWALKKGYQAQNVGAFT